MPDLRELLGDRYDDVIIKATKRALLNYPNLPISIEQHEALAGQALHAVLPDLLAQAWDEGADFVARHPDMSAEYVRAANPHRQEADHG